MKSIEVYRIAREAFTPWCTAAGFCQTKSNMPGWYKHTDAGYLIFWLQVSQDSWDPYAGSKFVVEFQLAERPEIGHGQLRLRLPQLLSDPELEEVRRMQNLVIAKLSIPPMDYYAWHINEDVSEAYRRKFEPVAEPYTRSDDVWLRYAEEEDVRLWVQFLLRTLPTVIERFERWAVARIRDDRPNGLR